MVPALPSWPVSCFICSFPTNHHWYDKQRKILFYFIDIVWCLMPFFVLNVLCLLLIGRNKNIAVGHLGCWARDLTARIEPIYTMVFRCTHFGFRIHNSNTYDWPRTKPKKLVLKSESDFCKRTTINKVVRLKFKIYEWNGLVYTFVMYM